ncbi:MAG: bis(5'-nucleosyl)-tetraphosphatase (symmetrical) YqeK [Dehalococcoidia bacterium]
MPPSLRKQIALIQAEFESRPEGLVRHVERVLVEALDLAQRYDLDPLRVELATWGHDLFRAFPPPEQLRLAIEAGLPIEAADRADPVLLHGPIAATTLRERFSVTDDEALAAVRDHTLGSPKMPIIAKVVLLADKFEKRKRDRTPVMKEIRRLAWRDLDLALLCWADWKWVQEVEHGWLSHPQHWTARTEWVREHHAELALPPRDAEESSPSEPKE